MRCFIAVVIREEFGVEYIAIGDVDDFDEDVWHRHIVGLDIGVNLFLIDTVHVGDDPPPFGDRRNNNFRDDLITFTGTHQAGIDVNGHDQPITGMRRMMKRVTHADSKIGMPLLTLNRSRKYQTSPGTPPNAVDSAAPLGKISLMTAMNSVVTKNSAKNITNLTMMERTTNANTAFNADKTIPNIAMLLYAARTMNKAINSHATAMTE